MPGRLDQKLSDRRRLDWRGWLTLAWVLWWGWAYALMAIQARGPVISEWVRSWVSGQSG